MSTNHATDSSNPLLDNLSDHSLLHAFSELVQQDCHRTAHLLRHIDLIDRRKLWAPQGYPSMFAFLVGHHRMSESMAGKRVGAARAARRFPVLFDMVARGEMHLSGIHRLKTHLTPENCHEVLAAAKHKTIREIEELVARLSPQPDAPSILRALPARNPVEPAAATTAAPAPKRAADPAPLSPCRFRLQVTLSQEGRDRLKQLQDLLAHQIPNGDPAAIVERALVALLTQVHKRKTGVTATPRARTARTQRRLRADAEATRYLEVAVRREAWTRDGGRCGFVGKDGHRCNETRGLEFAHIHPWAKGGANTAANLGLRCAGHNAWEAERDYGAGHMAKQRARAQKHWKVREHGVSYRAHRPPSDTTARAPAPSTSGGVGSPCAAAPPAV